MQSRGIVLMGVGLPLAPCLRACIPSARMDGMVVDRATVVVKDAYTACRSTAGGFEEAVY